MRLLSVGGAGSLLFRTMTGVFGPISFVREGDGLPWRGKGVSDHSTDRLGRFRVLDSPQYT